jgi:hypothetical protein
MKQPVERADLLRPSPLMCPRFCRRHAARYAMPIGPLGNNEMLRGQSLPNRGMLSEDTTTMNGPL